VGNVEYTVDSSHIGGSGSEANVPTIKLKNTTIGICGKETVVDNLEVFTIPLREEDKYFYGNLGQDVISRFDTLIINFSKMYLKFE